MFPKKFFLRGQCYHLKQKYESICRKLQKPLKESSSKYKKHPLYKQYSNLAFDERRGQ